MSNRLTRVMSLLVILLALNASLPSYQEAMSRLSLMALISASAQTGPPAREKASGSRKNYVGDTACGTCHQDIEHTYQHTVHHLTSRLPDKDSIAGKFSEGKNILKTLDPDVHFRMESKETSYYQTAVFWQAPNQIARSERFDFVIGSGEKGQSYLYWKGDRLFELPVSYWASLREWTNSPGYVDGTADFNRPIVPRCIECHASYFASIPSSPPQNRYSKAGFVLGISCENCHGPGREHVDGVRTHSATSLHRIVNLAALSRDRQVEVCAQCHGGKGDELAPAFTFVAGEPLEKYIKLHRPEPDALVDVHGNQVALLQRSRCYQSSSKMTCTTCHDVHAPARTAAAYSDKCLACHKPESCGMHPKMGNEIAKNCVDCHMPLQNSNLIVSNTDGKRVQERVRNHWIKVYPELRAH